MSKLKMLIGLSLVTLFAFSVAQVDAKKAKKAPTEQQCKKYGDADIPQMCGK